MKRLKMTDITKIYIDFKGHIPEMDNVDDCDWYIVVNGKVTDDMLEELKNYMKKCVHKMLIAEDNFLYYDDLTCMASEFMYKKYKLVEPDNPYDLKTIEVDTDEDS
jgi:hypothetical protein